MSEEKRKTRIIAVANQKGGVGKSSTATALTSGLARRGYKTLLLDLDPQVNSTDTFRGVYHEQVTLFDILVDGLSIKEGIQNRESLGELVPGDPMLADAEQKITQQGKEYRLKEALEPIDGEYDFIIMDTPPNLGILLTNALTAADSCIIPILPDRYSLQGLDALDETIRRVRRYSNPNLKIDGLLLVKNNPRTKLSREIVGLLPGVCKQLGTRQFKTFIRIEQAIQEAQRRRVPLFDWAPDCRAAKDYEDFITEYLGYIAEEEEK